MRKQVYVLLILLFSINLALSLYLEFKDFNLSETGICNLVPGKTDCSTVQNSEYSYTIGLKNTTIGIIFSTLFIVLTTFYYKHRHANIKLAKNILLAFASLGALRFIYIQFFVIKQICPYCLIIDILTLISFVVFYFETK
jgi:uncharacterized membrane protein